MKYSRLPLRTLCALILTIVSTVAHAETGDFIEIFASEPALSRPDGIVLGPDGKLYVSSESAVLRFDADTGQFIDVFTGRNIPPNLISKFDPKGLTFGACDDLNPASNCLYVASSFSRSVLVFDADENNSIDDGTLIKEIKIDDTVDPLFSPTALQFGTDGKLYASSSLASNFNQVYRFDAAGNFLDVFVSFSGGGLKLPKGLVFDSNDDLYVSSKSPGQVRKYTGDTGASLGVVVDGISTPNYLAFGPGASSDLYISSANGIVWRYPAGGGLAEEFARGNSALEGLLFGAGADLFVASSLENAILRFDGLSGISEGEFASKSGLDYPYDVYFGPDGNLWVSSELQGGILRFNGTTGEFIDIFATNPFEQIGLRHFAFDANGLLYAASNSANDAAVLKYNPTTETMEELIPKDALGASVVPQDIAFGGPDGDLYLVNSVGEVWRYDLIDTSLEVFIPADDDPAPAPPFNARALAFGPDDNVYIATDTQGVFQFDGSSGHFLGVFASADLPDEHDIDDLSSPSELVFGPDNNLYVSSTGDNRVVRFDGVTGAFIDEYVPTGSGSKLSTPNGLAFGPDGSLYVASRSTDEIQKYEGPIEFTDQDDDGVPDDDDLCPGNATGDSVDAVGCSDVQVDGDGDGVCDVGAPSAGPSVCVGIDNCPTVPNLNQLDSNENDVGDACESTTAEDVVPGVLDEIGTILENQNTSAEAAERLEKARNSLEKAQEKLADGDIREVLKEMSKAVKELLKAQNEGADVADLNNQLVEAARLEAQEAIDDAMEAGGTQVEIDRARQEMDKAQQDVDQGKLDKAMAHYRNAWDKAQKSL